MPLPLGLALYCFLRSRVNLFLDIKRRSWYVRRTRKRVLIKSREEDTHLTRDEREMLDGNPLELLKTGDYVELDTDRGIVTVGAHPPQKIQP